MIRFIKNWIKSSRLLREEMDVRDELYVMRAVARERSDNSGVKGYRHYYDFLDREEQRVFSEKAYRHQQLCQELELDFSEYFVPHRDVWKDRPDSPEAYLTVKYKNPDVITYEPDEDGNMWQHRNGVRDGHWSVPAETLFPPEVVALKGKYQDLD